jgi:transposase-like protein
MSRQPLPVALPCRSVPALHAAPFPNAESCLRLVRALTVERHEAWLEDHRYLNMDLLKEHKKETLCQAA